MVERDVEAARRVERRALPPRRRPRLAQGVADVRVPLHGELHDEQHAEDLVAGAVGRVGDGAGEDVAQREEALGELVVRPAKVEEGQREGLHGRGAGEAGHVVGQVLPYPGLARVLFALVLELFESRGEEGAETAAEGREDAADGVWEEDGAGNVGGARLEGRELPVLAGVDLDEVAVLLAQGAVAGQGGEGKVGEGGDGAQLGRDGVGCAGAEDTAVELGECVGEVAGEVGVLLVGAHNVWGGGEGVRGCRGGGRGRWCLCCGRQRIGRGRHGLWCVSVCVALDY